MVAMTSGGDDTMLLMAGGPLSSREAVFSALADPTRRAILNKLMRQPLTVKVIAADMPISQPAVSQHLKVLKHADLVAEQRQGRMHIYSANPVALDWLSWMFGSLRDDVLGARQVKALDSGVESSRDYDPVDLAMEQWVQVWPEHDSLSVGLIVRLRLISRHLEALSECAAERFGLNNVQVLLLATLDRISPHESTLTELSKVSFMSLPATAKHLDKAEQLGLIERTPDLQDGRSNLIRITDAGRQTLRGIMRSQREDEHSAVYGMPPEDRLQLAKLLRPVLAELRRAVAG